jgi:hypothetical protein
MQVDDLGESESGKFVVPNETHKLDLTSSLVESTQVDLSHFDDVGFYSGLVRKWC